MILIYTEKTFEELMPWAKDRAEGMIKKKHQLEDGIQEAYLALWDAINTFDPDQNIKFETYASTVIKNKLINYLVKDSRQILNVIYTDMDDVVLSQEPSAEAVMIRSETRDAIIDACEPMSHREMDVLLNRMLSDDPTTVRDLALQWRTSRTSIQRDEQRLRKRIKENYVE